MEKRQRTAALQNLAELRVSVDTREAFWSAAVLSLSQNISVGWQVFWGGYRGHERSDMLLMEKAHSGLAEGRSQCLI